MWESLSCRGQDRTIARTYGLPYSYGVKGVRGRYNLGFAAKGCAAWRVLARQRSRPYRTTYYAPGVGGGGKTAPFPGDYKHVFPLRCPLSVWRQTERASSVHGCSSHELLRGHERRLQGPPATKPGIASFSHGRGPSLCLVSRGAVSLPLPEGDERAFLRRRIAAKGVVARRANRRRQPHSSPKVQTQQVPIVTRVCYG